MTSPSCPLNPLHNYTLKTILILLKVTSTKMRTELKHYTWHDLLSLLSNHIPIANIEYT